MYHELGHSYHRAAGVDLQLGFTVIEFMIAIAIAAILVAIAGPSLADLIAAQRVKTATFEFYAVLALARSEAIKRNTVVNIAPRNGDFANGWDVRVGSTVLSSRLGLRPVAFSVPVGVTLAYDQDGRLTSSGGYEVRLAVSGNVNVATRCVIVDPAGRPSIRIDANRDGNCFNG